MTALHDTTDNAEGTLLAGISAAALSFTLQTAEGAEFPQPENGTADSPGDATTLNDSGDLGGLVVGQFIRNVTDGSYAIVLVTGAGTITTTRLKEGSDNLWESGDEWQANEFVATLEKRTGTTVDAEEKVLIKQRSTDLFTVRTRGFDGATAQTFDAGDFVNLHTVSNTVDDIIQVINDTIKRVDADETLVEANDVELANLRKSEPFFLTSVAGADTITASGLPTVGGLVDGLAFNFSAAGSNTGAATLNVDSLGAKKIVKFSGGSEGDLDSGDIRTDQIVTVVFDTALDSAAGAWVMVSTVGNVSAAPIASIGTVTTASANVGASSTAENTMVPTYTGSDDIGSSKLINTGDVVKIIFSGNYRLNSGDVKLRLKLGGTFALFFELGPGVVSASIRPWVIEIEVVARSVGGSGSLMPSARLMFSDSADGTKQSTWTGSDDGSATPAPAVTLDTTGSLAVTLTAQFGNSDASNFYNTQAGSIQIHAAP